MEALGAATTVIAVIETAAAVFTACLNFSLAVKDAKGDIQRLQDEANELQKLLARVADLASEPAADQLPALADVLAPGGPLETCATVMQEVLDKLGTNKGSEMRRFGLRALKWPFKSEEIDATMLVLERCKSSFNLALATDHLKLSLITRRETQEHRKGQYKKKIVQWLANVEAGVTWGNHEDARKRYEPETGAWLLQHSEVYQHWKQTPGELLWVWGMPGCGKTIMTSSIIEDIKQVTKLENDVMLAYFYFDFGTPAKQNVLNCARYILSQLIGASNAEPPSAIKDLYIKKYNYGNEIPVLSDITDMIETICTQETLSKMYFVLDGLDESPASNGKREELLDWLETLMDKIGDKLHLCASSRHENDIKEKFEALDSTKQIPMDEYSIAGDIKLYIQKSLSSHIRLKKLPPALKAEIHETLVEKAGGMFRWADCQLDDLKKCKTKPQVIRAMANLPSSLPATYERILEAISEDDLDYAKRALWWLVVARRPLTIEELAEAAVIDLDSDPVFHADYRFFDAREQLFEILGSLITVTKLAPVLGFDTESDPFTPASSSATQPAETVRLSHFSVQEYLLSEGLKSSLNERLRLFSCDQNNLDMFVSNCSLRYLNLYIESDDKQNSLDDIEEYPLLPYVAQRWFAHYELPTADADEVKALAVKLLREPTYLSIWTSIFAPDQPRKPLFTEPNDIGEGIHYAAQLGLNNVLLQLIAEGKDVNAKTDDWVTPLHYACNRRRTETILTLIRRGASINAQTKGGRAPMHEAAKKGSMLGVHLLACSGADLDLPDCDGWTPLYYACESNHIDVARYLLQEKDELAEAERLARLHGLDVQRPEKVPKADPNARTGSGGTALHQVSGRGYAPMVELLLRHEAECSLATTYGRTPLHQAAGGGSLAVVNLLVKAGADVAATDLGGTLARHLAEDNGHMEIATLLEDIESQGPGEPPER